MIQGWDDEKCTVDDIFNSGRTCLINIDQINEEMVQHLQTKRNRRNLITYFLSDKNETLTKEDDHVFSISYLKYENMINLGECEGFLRDNYTINNEEEILIYKHIIRI